MSVLNSFPVLLSSILSILLTSQGIEAAVDCGYNAVYDECANECSAPNCPGTILTCPLTLCEPGCKCNKGYILLNPGSGPCVPEDKCPPPNCTGKHEHWENGPNWCCPPTCENPDNGKQCKCAPKGACLCDKGYIRSKLGGPCIPIDKCPKNNTCGENEEPTDCGNVCTEPNCPGVRLPCPRNCQIGVCKCKSGYVRLRPGTEPSPCVEKSKCPKNCTGEHEFWDTGSNWCCPRTCANRDRETQVMCLCIADSGQCNCLPGFLRAKAGAGPCIPVDQCPNNTCKPNEVFTMATNWCCDGLKTCSNPNAPCNLFCTQSGGCICAPGYIREKENGDCIKNTTCPKKK